MNRITSKSRVYEILSGEATDPLGRAVNLGLVLLIATNVAAVIASSVAAIETDYGADLERFEVFSVTVFVLEYVLRLWSCPVDPRYQSPIVGRLRFMRSPLAIVDLVAVLPALIMWAGVDLRFLRILRLTRMLRLAKLGRYSNALQRMSRIVHDRREELVLSLMMMLLVLVVASSLMYLAEHESQPEIFSSIPAAMWWGITTLTTVGYGDVYPVTLLGKIMGAVIAVMGIGVFALPAGIIASGFVDLRERSSRVSGLGTCPHCGQSIEPPKV